MKKCLLRAMLVAMFMVVAVFAWGQSVFYEEPFDANQGWTLEPNWSIATGALTLGWSPSTLNYDLSATSPDIVVPATAGDVIVTQYIDEYSGQGTPPETFEIIAVANGTPNVLWSYSTDTDWGVTGGQDLTLSLAPYAGQTIQLKFRATGATTFNYNYWYIYGIVAYASLNNDLAATSISGVSTPSIGSPYPYVITVRNTGLSTVTNYSVKLMKTGDVEIGSVAGTSIAPQAILEYTIPWTPTALGETQIWGKVVMTDDDNPNNDQTAHLAINVMEAGLLVVELGNGTTTNTNTSASPYGTYYKNFRQQYLYTADEIYAAGGAPGLINSLAFNVQSIDQCTAMPNYRIRLKHTEQTALTTAFEAGEYTQVWQAAEYMPTNDWNLHVFSNPFFWDGASNLLVDIVTDIIPGSYARNALVYQTTTPFASALRYQSDSSPADAATTGTTATMRANARFFLLVDDMGSLTGTVTTGGSPLEGVLITVDETVFSTITAANGTYTLPHVPVGSQTVIASKHGYADVSHIVTIVEDQATTQNFAMTLLPQVAVTGRIVGSDNPTVGIADATITLTGYEPYTATTNASGQFSIPNVFSGHTYGYTANAAGYATTTGTVEVGSTAVNMGDIVVNEIALPPFGVVATEADNFQSVALSWEAPDPNAVDITEGFEGTEFPPADWSQIVTDTGPANTLGVLPTWCQIGEVALNPSVAPHGGEYQAAMWWSYSHQDEWLITPQFACPGNAALTFWSYVFFGSVNDDHYYVKVSTDGGTNWTTLWDATTLTGGQNAYDTPISIDLSAYAGQQIKLALHAEDPPSNDGMWYVWFVDDVVIGSPSRTISFNSAELSTRKAHKAVARGTVEALPISRDPNYVPGFANSRTMDRALQGYKVYRMLAADQQNEANWITLTPSVYGQTSYADNAWGPLPSGIYKYAVKAVYTNNVMSPAAFSAELHKGMMGTLTGTVTESGTELPVEGATVTAGEYSGLTNAQGMYSFAVYAGTYNVTATKTGYQSATQNNVVITGTQTTTANFTLTEITLPPAAVQAVEAGNNVNITWMAPGSGAELTEGFEGAAFPPADWSQVINNTGPANTLGVLPTWCRVGTVALTPAVAPHGGENQAAMWWSYDHQDEWLKTPAFNCLPGASLTFWSYVYFGSTNGDHYYVKVSTNGGSSWTVLWDASTQTGGQNAYTTPITIDLSNYGGQEIMLAFHAEDPPTNDGMWYVWFIDDIHIGTPNRTITFNNNQLSRARFEENRAMEGYRVWRLLQGQESNEAQWTSLTPNSITATAHQDTQWNTLPDGIYKWAVKAVYTGGALSNSAFSNPVERLTQVGTIAGIVRNASDQPISGATVATGTYTVTTAANGAYSLIVPAGTHTVTASHPNYTAVTQPGVIVVTGQTTTLDFNLPASVLVLNDGFESYADFATTFAPWTLVDVDGSDTYGITNTAWLNAYAPQAFIIFNPANTTPPVTSAEAHGGAKFAASFAATTPPNDDWMITPQIPGGGELKFWAKSFTADYGLERFKVGVSTTGTAPADFSIISAGNFIEAPVDWTEYTYDLAAYAEQQIYVGIQCVSNDAFIFFVDDVTITGPTSNEDGVAPVYTTQLIGNYPNPFNPETNIRFSLKDAAPVSIEIYNVKGQMVRKLVNDVKAAGDHVAVWNGTDNNGRAVSSGVYYFKMNTGKYSSTKKMILMK